MSLTIFTTIISFLLIFGFSFFNIYIYIYIYIYIWCQICRIHINLTNIFVSIICTLQYVFSNYYDNFVIFVKVLIFEIAFMPRIWCYYHISTLKINVISIHWKKNAQFEDSSKLFINIIFWSPMMITNIRTYLVIHIFKVLYIYKLLLSLLWTVATQQFKIQHDAFTYTRM